MTFAEESGKGKAGIFVKGEVLAPAEFIDKYAGTNNPGKNERLSYAVLSRIAAHPEDFACLNMEEKAAALKTLMTEPSIKNSKARINQLPEDIFAEKRHRKFVFVFQIAPIDVIRTLSKSKTLSDERNFRAGAGGTIN